MEEKNKIKEEKEDKKQEQTPDKAKEIQSKTDIKKDTETKKQKQIIKKDRAYVLGKDLPVSTKQSMGICRFIKNKNPEKAILLLEQVMKKRISIPFKGEIPHRKELKGGFSGGRYPLTGSKIFIKLLKSLIANAKTNGLDTERIIITTAKANIASRPIKPTRMAYGRKKFKRSHIFIETKEIIQNLKKEKGKK